MGSHVKYPPITAVHIVCLVRGSASKLRKHKDKDVIFRCLVQLKVRSNHELAYLKNVILFVSCARFQTVLNPPSIREIPSATTIIIEINMMTA